MLKLYTAQVCPFAHRCRLALTLAELGHERVEIDLAAIPDWYRQLSPYQKVPLLEHDGQKNWESAIINEYLADCFPPKALQPADPLLRARSRLAVDWAGSQLIPVFYQVLRNSPEEAAEKLARAVAEAPDWMSDEGPFWLGPQPTLADLAIYPWFERWPVLQHYRNVALDFPPRLALWRTAMQQHPAVQAEAGNLHDYITAYARYAA